MAKRRPRFESLESRLCLSPPTLQTTFSLPTTGSWTPTVYRASPIFTDIFGTGKDDLIVVTAGAQLVAYASGPNNTATPVVTYQVPGGVADIKATPIVIFDPLTGRKELYAAMGRNEDNIVGGPTIEDGRVFGWDLQTGKLLPAFVSGISTGTNPAGQAGVYGALTSGDLQGNGVPVLVVTSFSHEVTAITLQGNVLWQWNNDDTIESGAVVADINRDGKPEVIVGGDSSAGTYYQQGGWVNVLNNNGQLLWRKQIPGEVTWSSPVVADLLNNGYLDIVIGTGLNFSSTLTGAAGQAATAQGDYIYAFDPFGNLLPGWPYHTTTSTSINQNHEILAGLAVADIAGNGQLDVTAVDRSGVLHVVQPNGQDLPGFSGGYNLVPDLTLNQIPDDYASPIIADIMGGGVPDIVATASVFVRAVDPHGNLIQVGTAPLDSQGKLEQFDVAPAIGNFYGSGGLAMALVSYDPYNNQVPDQVQIYQLSPSTVTPPWPSMRRTVSGDAVMRSPTYDQIYVTQAFNTLLGSQPSGSTVQTYVNNLNMDASNLLNTAQQIAISLPVEQAKVARIYQSLLGQTADAYALSYWSNYLETHQERAMEVLVASSPAFAQRANGSVSQEVIYLYQAILNRTPSQSEVNGWVSSGLPAANIASAFINSSEGITDEFNTIIQSIFGPGTQGYIPPDDLAAYSLQFHAGTGESQLTSQILASAGNFVYTNYVAGYIRSLYRDVLNRNASAAEVANWIRSIDTGSVVFGNLATIFVSSLEAKEDYVQSEFATLLGTTANASTLATLAMLPNREAVAIFIVGSAQFFAQSGGTNASFVTAAYLDLGGIAASPATVSFVAGQLASGASTRSSVAAGIIYGGPLYFTQLAVNQLLYYIPDESQGVLRTGEGPPNGPAINPAPGLISYLVSLYQGGYSDEQVLGVLLTSPQYANQVAYNRGFYRSPGVRY